MKLRFLALGLAASLLIVGGGWAFFEAASSGDAMTAAAQKYLASLSAEQRKLALLEYETPARLDWHIFPKDTRKGVQIRDMSAEQRQAAHALLRACLSEAGYDKTVKIMQLEIILRELQKGKPGPLRDPERYFFTVFGEPSKQSRWGLSVEGHHLSLNFVVDKGEVISCTPLALGINPAVVQTEFEGAPPKGARLARDEEELAFALLGQLNAEQRAKAIIAAKAIQEVRDPGAPQPPTAAPVGVSGKELTPEQLKTLRKLVLAYAGNWPDDVAASRLIALEQAGWDTLRFAWAGAEKPGVGHYYRVQGPTLLIELVNTQPDLEGNIANHVHLVVRDMGGDFARPLAP